MNRDDSLARLSSRHDPWDMAVIGGGATGLGIAVDAASRGYAVVLLERSDFGKGTSSRSTKLIHGGVRYLKQGNLSLVRESLHERGLLFANAPHLVSDRELIVPSYAWWEKPFYGTGLKAYSLLAGRRGLGGSTLLSRDETLQRVPTLATAGLRGGVAYHDGQFDDARMLIALARTANRHGACLLNYAAVIVLHHDAGGAVKGLTMRDELSGVEHNIEARAIINATGPFTDAVRRLDDAAQAPIISPSQGAHIVLPRRFLPGSSAVMVPRTSDGRILFAIPWQGHALIGTTDTPIRDTPAEPTALTSEIEFLLATAGRYLNPQPAESDILSVFVGIRPLVNPKGAKSTAAISREHLIDVSRSGLLTIAGGKWTTYRKMAEDAVGLAARHARLEARPCVTQTLRLHGWHADPASLGDWASYGSDANELQELATTSPELSERLHPELPIAGAQIAWAARHEMAQTLEDVLARRTRALFLNARAAVEMAPAAVEILARELGRDAAWAEAQLAEFRELAANYRYKSE